MVVPIIAHSGVRRGAHWITVQLSHFAPPSFDITAHTPHILRFFAADARCVLPHCWLRGRSHHCMLPTAWREVLGCCPGGTTLLTTILSIPERLFTAYKRCACRYLRLFQWFAAGRQADGTVAEQPAVALRSSVVRPALPRRQWYLRGHSGSAAF